MRLLSLLTLMLVPLMACADEPKGLPAEWHGTWKGTLAEIGETKGHTVEVTIASKDNSKEVLLTIAQDKNTKGEWVRKYNLLPNKPKDLKIKDARENPNRRIDDQSLSYVTSQSSGTVLWLRERRPEHHDEDVATYRFELRDGSLRLEQCWTNAFRHTGVQQLAELKLVK